MPTEVDLPISHPNNQFVDAQAFARFLNLREANGELVTAIGSFEDESDPTHKANWYAYEDIPIAVPPVPTPQPLFVREIPEPAASNLEAWIQFIAPLALQNVLVDRADLFLSGGKRQVALLRPVEEGVQIVDDTGGRQKLVGKGHWDWLTPVIDGEDFWIKGARVTWFGGPNDSQDDGKTASGRVNTRMEPDFQGCALPMNGFKGSSNTMGSPIPRFQWLTPVEVSYLKDPSVKPIVIPLIDLGPAYRTNTALDLTEPAFTRFALANEGSIKADVCIRNFRKFLDPRAIAFVTSSSLKE
jgi:hypothetical protein